MDSQKSVVRELDNCKRVAGENLLDYADRVILLFKPHFTVFSFTFFTD